MEISECLAAIKRRFALIAAMTVLAALSALAVSLFLIEKDYVSTATIIACRPIALSNANCTDSQAKLLDPNYIKVYYNLANSNSMAESIIQRLHLKSTAEEIKDQISIAADYETGILKVSVKTKCADLSRDIAQAFIESLKEQSDKLSLKTEIQTIDAPKVPQLPSSPNIPLNILLSAIGGFLAGILLAMIFVAREQSADDTFASKKLPAIRLLGKLPKLRRRSSKCDVILLAESSMQSEAVKEIRTNLQALMNKSCVKSFMITSPYPAEEKTTFAVNISASLAQLGKKVLLVECNFHRPALNMIRDFEGDKVVDLPYRQIDKCKCKIWRIPSLGIDLISAFYVLGNRIDIVGSRWMSAFLDKVEKDYDIVILDCPPVLPYDDALILGTLVKNVVIVAGYGRLTYPMLEKCSRRFGSVGANILGVVMNNMPQTRMGSGYISESHHPLLRKTYLTIIKRIFDIAVSSVLLLAISPFLLIISLLVRFTSKGPAFFCHKRIGQGGKEFHVYKFRTMLQDAEKMKNNFSAEQQAEFQESYKLRHDPRVTPFGRILRETSLDELPQFLNVLKGEMSIVGPRPITSEELTKYGSYSDMLLSVKPGITGLWQVSGRSDTSYADRVRLDVQYINHCGFLMDLKIFMKTLIVVASRLGAH